MLYLISKTILFFSVFFLLGCADGTSAAEEKSKPEQEITPTKGNVRYAQTDESTKSEGAIEVPWKIIDTRQLKDHLKNQLTKASGLVANFKQGKLLYEKSEVLHNSSDRSIYRLKTLTEQDLISLRSSSVLSESHFGIQTAQYWEKIYELQRKGLTIAYFSENNLSRGIAGLYMDGKKMIVLRPLGSLSTLEHEERHYEQYIQLSQRKAANKNNNPNILPEECKAILSQSIGEIDATLHEYRDLNRLIVKIPNADQVPFKVPTISHYMLNNLPLEDFLYAFEYIVTSGERLKRAEKSCPQALHAMIANVSDFIELNQRQTAKTITNVSINLDSLARLGGRSDIIKESKKEYDLSVKAIPDKVGGFFSQLKVIIKSEVAKLSPEYRTAVVSNVSGLSFYTE